MERWKTTDDRFSLCLSVKTLRRFSGLQKIRDVLTKYDESYVSTHLHSVGDINKFAATFYKDVAEIYDCITRVRNLDRNPTGFSMHDAPILGLLVRIWKLLKEIIKYYEADNADSVSILERPLIEASVTATYLLRSDNAVVEDYRKCSYKHRLRILRDLSQGSPFFETKAGKRLLKSVREKMTLEDLTTDDFQVQEQNRWRLQGNPFSKIFSEVVDEQLYASTYGMMSESIHGSWNESIDYCLRRNEDGTFSTFPFHQPTDIRFVTPTIRFCNPPFGLWLTRIEVDEKYLFDVLNWIDRVNSALFRRFDEKYDG